MRIISEDRDYYDGAGWVDSEVVFRRAAWTPDESAHARFTDLPFRFPMPMSFPFGENEVAFSWVMICVAGFAYPVMRREIRSRIGKHALDVRFIAVRDEAMENVKRAAMESGRQEPGKWLGGNQVTSTEFLTSPQGVMSDWCLDHGAVTAVLLPGKKMSWRDPLDVAHGMTNVSGLSGFGMVRALDPATAFMRISGYISGVIGQTREIETLSNDSRIMKAGFDKTSFRRSPEK